MSAGDGRDPPREVAEGVSGGSQGGLFESSEAERMLAEAAPFRVMPRGGSRRGSPNKRTVAMRELYLKMGLPHPMLWLGQLLTLTVDELAARLGCDPIDALAEQRKAAADLAPYLESKMPAKLDVQPGEGLPVLVVREIDTPAAMRQARAEGALAIDDDLAEALENQSLGAGDGGGSHGEGSHGARQATDKPSESDE